MFHLYDSYEGHSGDIKGIAETDESLVSCSRDCSVKFWQLDKSYFHEGYVNSLTAAGYVISGSADKTIIVSHKADQVAILIGHNDNVCALDVRDDLILSGSWDSTVKLWKNFECILTIQGHQLAVWDVKFVQNYILSASADKSIKLWDLNGKLLITFMGHRDVVRSLSIIPHVGFVSCSNDGTLRIWALSGECLKVIDAHSSFIYSVSVLCTGEIISAGEDRTVKVWDTKGTCLQTIAMPCNSIWVVKGLKNGDFAVGGSDAVLRVFSRDKKRIASDAVLQNFEKSVAESAIPASQVGDLNMDKIASPEALAEPGSKEGQIKLVKDSDGVYAFQWSISTQEWVKVGKVTDAIGSNRKQLYDGKEYDYVFDIDIAEGAPPIKLPYNVTENPYQVAQEFIFNYELPQDYLDQIANFIINNTKGVSLGVVSGGGLSDPFTGAGRYVPPGSCPSTEMVSNTPEASYVVLKSGNLDSIKNKIVEFNKGFSENQHSLDNSEIILLEGVIESLKQRKCNFTDNQIMLIKRLVISWPTENRFPALDLLSDIAGLDFKMAAAVVSIDHLLDGLDFSHNMTRNAQIIAMLKLRCISNIVSHGEAADLVIEKLNNILRIMKMSLNAPFNNKNLALAIATLNLNIAILLKKKSVNYNEELVINSGKILSLCGDVEYKNLVLLALITLLKAVPVDFTTKKDIKAILQEARKEISDNRLTNMIDEILSLTG